MKVDNITLMMFVLNFVEFCFIRELIYSSCKHVIGIVREVRFYMVTKGEMTKKEGWKKKKEGGWKREREGRREGEEGGRKEGGTKRGGC